MRRWLRLGVAAIAMAAMLAACAGEEEAAGPAATPARTGTGTAGSSDRIPTVAAPAVTPRLPTATATTGPATPTPPPPTPTPPPPTPTGAVPTPQARQPVWAVSQVPGAAAVDIVLEDGLGNAHTIASVDPEVVQWETWDMEPVADLDGNGTVEAVVLHFTGGAHCCFEYWIFSEGTGGIHLDDAFLLNNASIGDIRDLDGDRVLEIETGDDRLAYFPDLSFAGSPFLPMVLCRQDDGTYYDCTPEFPEQLQESAREFEQMLADAVQRQAGDEEKRSAALGLVAASLLLAPTDEGWIKVRNLCPECEAWLLENSEELENRLAIVQPQPVGQ